MKSISTLVTFGLNYKWSMPNAYGYYKDYYFTISDWIVYEADI